MQGVNNPIFCQVELQVFIPSPKYCATMGSMKHTVAQLPQGAKKRPCKELHTWDEFFTRPQIGFTRLGENNGCREEKRSPGAEGRTPGEDFSSRHLFDTVGWTARRQWVGYISLNFSAAWSSYCCCKCMSSFFSSAVFCSVPGCP